MHTNKKKPEADRKITLNKEAFGFFDMGGFNQSKVTLQRQLAKD